MGDTRCLIIHTPMDVAPIRLIIFRFGLLFWMGFLISGYIMIIIAQNMINRALFFFVIALE